MLKKFIKKLVTVTAVFVLGIIALFISAPRLSDNIYEAKSLSSIPKNMKLIHNKASEYKQLKGEWPLSLDSISSKKIYVDTTSFTFDTDVRGDTFIVKGIVQEEHPRIPRKFIGGFVTVDNFGNKTYSHDEFKSKYLRSYLYEAKKVELK